MLIFVIIFILIGLLMVALSIPLIRGKVPPNVWYGFRIRLTLENPDIWYPANAYAGRLLLIAGVATSVAALLCALIPGISVDGYSILVSVLMLGVLLLLLVFSIRYAKSLEREVASTRVSRNSDEFP